MFTNYRQMDYTPEPLALTGFGAGALAAVASAPLSRQALEVSVPVVGVVAGTEDSTKSRALESTTHKD